MSWSEWKRLGSFNQDVISIPELVNGTYFVGRGPREKCLTIPREISFHCRAGNTLVRTKKIELYDGNKLILVEATNF